MSLELSYEEEDYGLDNGPVIVRLPVLKLRQQGQQWVLMMAFLDHEAPLMEYGKQNVRALNFKGEPATQDLLTGYVMPQTSCTMVMPKRGDNPAQEVPATPGTLVRAYIKGHNRYDDQRNDSFMDVARAFKEAGEKLEAGDVVLGCLSNITLEGRDRVALQAPKHVVSFAIRKSRPEERDMVAIAQAKFVEMRAAHRAAAASAPPQPQPQSAPAFSPVPANWGAAPAVAPAPAPAPAPTPWPSTPAPAPAPAPLPAAPADNPLW